MRNLVEIICAEFQTPEGRNLQERCLESMILIERSRGRSDAVEIAPNTADADIRPEVITRLADTLASFVRAFPQHPDVGSAVWALGKLCDARLTSLFEHVLSPSSNYSESTHSQARVALEDLAFNS